MAERTKTGIEEFDKVIEGGLITNSVNLLAGGTGTGKTIFCLQFLYNGAKQYNEKGIYISFEESIEDLKADAAVLGFDFNALSSKVKFVHIPLYKLGNFSSYLKNEVSEFRPKRLIIDSISALAMPMEDDFERRKEVNLVKEALKEINCTSILISEVTSESAMGNESGGSFSRYSIEEFLCDSLIVLYYAGIGGESDRAIRVVKMRKTNHLRGPIPMEIGKSGIKVSKSKFLRH